jgi:hypothetical protein
MMMEKYRTEVRRFYLEQKAAGALSLNLTYATTSKLRDECLMLFSEGCSELDLRILKSFLGRPQKEQLHESAIRRMDTDKFKALTNFLKKEIKTTEKNFELLAWLVDFKSRPYSKYLMESRKNAVAAADQPTLKPQMPDDSLLLNFRQIISEEHTVGDKNPANSLMHHFEKPKEMQKVIGRRPEIGIMQREPFLLKRFPKNRQQELGKSKHTDSYKSKNALTEPFNGMEAPFKPSEGEKNHKITLEYPSGVKISVSASDLDLISKLVRL